MEKSGRFSLLASRSPSSGAAWSGDVTDVSVVTVEKGVGFVASRAVAGVPCGRGWCSVNVDCTTRMRMV